LAFTQRTIRASRRHISANRRRTKPFPATVKTFGDELQVKCLEKGLSARQLAVALETSVSTVTAWERNESLPNRSQFAMLNQVLEMGEGILSDS